MWSVLEAALMAFAERCLFSIKRMEQWLSMVAFLVRMCWNIFYWWFGTEVVCEMIFINAVSWEAHRIENYMSWGHDPREGKSNR